MVVSAVSRIDDILKENNNELTSSRFVARLNRHVYGKTWSDTMRDTLQALSTDVTPRFPIHMAKTRRSTPGFDSTGRSQACDNADDAFRAARRNLIGAIIEYEERNHADDPRSTMEIMRDRRVAEQQLVRFLCYTGYMGEEVAREHVRTFERLVKAQIATGVDTGLAQR